MRAAAYTSAMRPLAISILCFALASPPAWGCGMLLHVASHPVCAEIADTPQAREHGLMQRKTLCDNCGMLFVFPVAKPYAFWMKDTPLPLDIAFIAPDGHIINIAGMQPYTTDNHSADGNALYALEMNRGWFDRHRIKPGDRMDSGRAAPVARQ
jgi:uncharacterized membrane protein (UPF0127 family)